MKQRDILDAMGGIAQDYVEQAAPGRKPVSKNRIWLRAGAVAACICVVIGCIFGFSQRSTFVPAAYAVDLMAGVTPQSVDRIQDMTGGSLAMDGFAVSLLQNTVQTGENTLISPLSVLSALAMTANGAKGQTRRQMEAAFGMEIETLNFWMYSYLQSVNGEDSPLTLANSVWFRDHEGFQVKDSFLQTNANFYGADAFKAPFTEGTVEEINQWVEDNTDGLISQLLDQIPANAMMYLANAVSFDAKWERPYSVSEVSPGIFTKEDGTQQEATMLCGVEEVYLEDENTTGFVKYYKGREFAFVALLPKEGMTVEEYVEGLTGEALARLLESQTNQKVYTELPKFQVEFSGELSGALQDMGMTHAFGEKADFGGIASGTSELMLSRVLHKTFINVNEDGTQAGAATLAEALEKGMDIAHKSVCLNRPFVYMLMDVNTGSPIFLGVMNHVAGS